MSPKLFLLLVALVCYFMIPVESGRVHKSKRAALDSAFRAKKFVIRLRRDAEPETAPAVVETQIIESVDWASWLQGVVADIEGVVVTFNNHRLDFATLAKLDVNSLQSIGISSEDAAKIISKITLEAWLTGVVSNDDISFVIKACLDNRITLESLTKLSLADIASTGIALGDATRIYAKSHPGAETATTLPAAVDASPNTTAPIIINIVLTGADNTTTVASIQIGANLTADNSTISASINTVDNTTTTETEVEEDEDDEEVEVETEIILVEPTIITTASQRRALRNKRSVEGRKTKSTAEKKGKKKSGNKKTKKTRKNKKQLRR